MSDSRFNYDAIAAAYAAKVDSSSWNALYERPAMIAQLPPVQERTILDAGCGSGWYATQLLAGGATVDCIDASERMVALARSRFAALPPDEARRVTVQVASLGETLPFKDARFDGAISPLVLHYLEDWRPALREIRRVLAPGGWLLLSTHHPAADAALFETSNYFATEHVVDNWEWVGRVEFYRRSLTEIFASLRDTDFIVDAVTEPALTAEFRDAEPDAAARVANQPAFLIIRANRA